MEKLNGLIAINKPSGIVSHDIVEYMRHILLHFKKHEPWLSSGSDSVVAAPSITNHLTPIESQKSKKRQFRKWPAEAKVGHGGTLDPLASGVLILGVGSGTKSLQHYLTQTRKVYVASGLFGSATDTYDSTGKVVKTGAHEHITKDKIEQMLQKHFSGEIDQLPPVYSALKVNGERMCDIMRNQNSDNQAALEKAQKPRKVTIYSAELLEWTGSDKEFKLRVACGSGTYIRSIIHDLGELLESCAHMTQLVREGQGSFSLNADTENAIPVLEVDQLNDYNILSEYLQNETYKRLSEPQRKEVKEDQHAEPDAKRQKTLVDHGN